MAEGSRPTIASLYQQVVGLEHFHETQYTDIRERLDYIIKRLDSLNSTVSMDHDVLIAHETKISFVQWVLTGVVPVAFGAIGLLIGKVFNLG